MKKLILIVLIICLFPTFAAAELTEEQFWSENLFLYNFSVTRTALRVEATYTISTGTDPIGTGDWRITILGPHDQELIRQSFSMKSNTTNVWLRYQPNGTSARIQNPSGTVELDVNLVGSRVCNEDGLCDTEYGEVANNCPVDCGSAFATTAATVAKSGIGKRLGAALMGLALAATGLLILRGVRGFLDRRHGS